MMMCCVIVYMFDDDVYICSMMMCCVVVYMFDDDVLLLYVR